MSLIQSSYTTADQKAAYKRGYCQGLADKIYVHHNLALLRLGEKLAWKKGYDDARKEISAKKQDKSSGMN